MAGELDVARSAAHAAGALALRHRRGGLDDEWKGPRDLVTEADRAAERLIRERIGALFPDDVVVGEEGRGVDESEVAARRRWYVDPIDGTANFFKGRHWWAVSIAFCDADDRLAAGVVHLPALDETYEAVRGGGATLAGRAIHASDVTDLSVAMCASGFPGAAKRAQESDRNVGIWRSVMHQAMSVRAFGAVAPDVCTVAAGVVDGYWTLGVERWDLAAATLIAVEAGARVTDLDGRPVVGPTRAVVAAAPGIHAALLKLVQDGAA